MIEDALKILGIAVLLVGGPALLIWLLWWGAKERPE